MRVPRPTVVSFSTSAPRPTTTSSAIVTRSRTHAWSPTMHPAPSREPAKTIAPVEMTVPSPTTVGSSGPRFAVDLRPSVGCLPTTAFSSTRTSSPSTVPGYTVALGWTSAMEGGCQPVERAHDACSVVGDLAPVALAADQLQERLTLELQRLVGGDLRDVDVARAGLPLAVALRALPRRLLVDGHLSLQLHVVEDDHLLASDHGHLAHLVWIEPRQVHVGDLAAREAEIAEHD